MQNIPGKKLFDEHSSSEDEDSISESEQHAQDEDTPLIHSIRRTSKLRSLGLESKFQTKTGNSVRATDNVSASRTSGISY